MVVVDEAHNVRNPGTERADALRRLVAGTPPKQLVMLTATPVNNSLWDLYYLLAYFVKSDSAFASSRDPLAPQALREGDGARPRRPPPRPPLRRARRHRGAADAAVRAPLLPARPGEDRRRRCADHLPEAAAAHRELRARRGAAGILRPVRRCDGRAHGQDRRRTDRPGAGRAPGADVRALRALPLPGGGHGGSLRGAGGGPAPLGTAEAVRVFLARVREDLPQDGGQPRRLPRTSRGRLGGDRQDAGRMGCDGLRRRRRARGVRVPERRRSRVRRTTTTSMRCAPTCCTTATLLLDFAAEAEQSRWPRIRSSPRSWRSWLRSQPRPRPRVSAQTDTQDRRKVLVFSYFADTVDWIVDHLEERTDSDPRLGDYSGRLAAAAGGRDGKEAALFGFAPRTTDAPPGRTPTVSTSSSPPMSSARA